MTDQDHVQLLSDFKKGDEAAFKQVFRFYYKPLRLQAFLILKNEEEAEDLVQQLFLDLWNKQLYRNVHQSLKAYLHMAIRNRSLNYLAKSNMEIKMRQEYAGRQANLHQWEENPDQPFQLNLLAVLNELPPQRYKAFSLVHIKDKKYHEAALEMGISINSLKSHLKLAVKFLRVRLKTTTIHLFTK